MGQPDTPFVAPCVACWMGDHSGCEGIFMSAAGIAMRCTCRADNHNTPTRPLTPPVKVVTVGDQLAQIAVELAAVAAMLDKVAGQQEQVDRNARAHGWSIGQGHSMADAIDSDPTNPFLHEDWRNRITPEATDAPQR